MKEFDIDFISSTLDGDIAELVFHYKMTSKDQNKMDFKGKHRQFWKDGKITKEEYFSVE